MLLIKESKKYLNTRDEQRAAYQEVSTQVKDEIMVEIEDKAVDISKLGVLQGITKLDS